MINYLTTAALSIVTALFVVLVFSAQTAPQPVIPSFGADASFFTNPVLFQESVTLGGENCTLTDANGGTYTLTDDELYRCSMFKFAAGGTGQAVIALTFPATSTMKTSIPDNGDCKQFLYDASALAAATTTTLTAGAGHNIIAYTVNDDVIDGGEFSLINMCRTTSGDVNTIVTELLHAD